MTLKQKRPRGITALAILNIFVVVLILFGIQLLLYNSTTRNPYIAFERENLELAYFHQISSTIDFVFSVILIGVGIVCFIIGLATLKGKSWVWKSLVIEYILSNILTIYTTKSLSIYDLVTTIVGLSFNSVIIYYLYRPHVKAYFGKYQTSKTTNPES